MSGCASCIQTGWCCLFIPHVVHKQTSSPMGYLPHHHHGDQHTSSLHTVIGYGYKVMWGLATVQKSLWGWEKSCKVHWKNLNGAVWLCTGEGWWCGLYCCEGCRQVGRNTGGPLTQGASNAMFSYFVQVEVWNAAVLLEDEQTQWEPGHEYALVLFLSKSTS